VGDPSNLQLLLLRLRLRRLRRLLLLLLSFVCIRAWLLIEC
jgi:hypothetical protein